MKLLLIRYDAALRAKADSWKDTANEELEKECLGSLIELISSPEVEDAKQEAQVEKKSASSEKLSEEKQQILQQLLKSKKEQDSRKIPDLKPLGAPQKDTYRPSTEKPKLNPHADSFKPKSKLPQSPAAEKVKEIVPTTTRNTGRNSPGNKDIISPSRQMPTDQKQDGHRSLRSNVYRPDSDRKSASNEDHNLKKDNVDLKRKPDPVVVDQSYRPSSSSGNSGRKTGERILYESPKHKSSHTYRPSDNQQQSKRSSESEPRTETAKRQKLDDRDISQRRGPTPTSTTYRPDPTQNASQTYIPSSNNRSNSNNDRKQPLPSQSDRKRGTNTSTNNGTASRPLPYRSTRQYPRR